MRHGLIRYDIRTKVRFVKCSLAARLLYFMLHCEVDDHGAFKWEEFEIWATCFPGDKIEVGPLLDELVENGLILKRSFADRFRGTRHYGYIVGYLSEKAFEYPYPGGHPVPDDIWKNLGSSLEEQSKIRRRREARAANKKKRDYGNKLRFEVLERDGFACQYCGATAPDAKLHVDHIKPISQGGTNDPSNLTTSCSDCNQGKFVADLSDHPRFKGRAK